MAEKTLDKTGIVIGRFQVFHNDHLRYVLAGKSLCDNLVIGITNPDPTYFKDDPSDPHRSLVSSNPLSYFERYVMLKSVMRENGISYMDFSIVPFPINTPEIYCYYVPMSAVAYITVYDRWGQRKLELLKSGGLHTRVLWEKPAIEKGITGSEVRRRIALNEPWEHLVPKSIAALIKDWNLESKLRVKPTVPFDKGLG